MPPHINLLLGDMQITVNITEQQGVFLVTGCFLLLDQMHLLLLAGAVVPPPQRSR